MQKLILAIHNRTNALLEAPTGCGKTLAILCGALAWQTKLKKEAEEMEAAGEIGLYDIGLTQGTPLAPHTTHLCQEDHVCTHKIGSCLSKNLARIPTDCPSKHVSCEDVAPTLCLHVQIHNS